MFRQERHKKQPHTLASIQNKLRGKLRKQQLQLLFSTVRNASLSLIHQQQQQQHAYQSQMPMPLPMMLPQLPVIDFNVLLQQYLSMQQPFNYLNYQSSMLPLMLQPAQAPPPLQVEEPSRQQELSLPIREEPIRRKQEEVYFEKENFRVYRKLIGQGSYSRVWQGVNLRTGQRIAAKQIKKFDVSESKCLKRLDSPHIIKIYSFLSHRSSTFLILEHCQRNLRDEMDFCSYRLDKILGYFDQIVKGMDVLQQHNLIHRDLKFENILINDGIVKIADFGLAKYMGDELQVESRKCGTPYTMAPQIYFATDSLTNYTIKCDIWSLGIILHQMLYNQHPFGSNQQFKKRKRIKINKKFGVLDQIIDKCLVFSPEDRICWSAFMDLFRMYQNNKKKYENADIFPIEAQSIIVEPEQPIKIEQQYCFKKKGYFVQKSEQQCSNQMFKYGSVQQRLADIKVVESVIYLDKKKIIEEEQPQIPSLFENMKNKTKYLERVAKIQLPQPPEPQPRKKSPVWVQKRKPGKSLLRLFQPPNDHVTYTWVQLPCGLSQPPLPVIQSKPQKFLRDPKEFQRSMQAKLQILKRRKVFELSTLIFFIFICIAVVTMI